MERNTNIACFMYPKIVFCPKFPTDCPSISDESKPILEKFFENVLPLFGTTLEKGKIGNCSGNCDECPLKDKPTC